MGVFGSIQRGSGKRFSSQNPSQVRPFDINVSNAQLADPTPPMEYSGLKVGPDFAIEYEPNQALGIDGGNSLSRTLSPFMIQVEPPLAYASQGQKTKGDLAGILQAGHGAAPSAYQAARNSVDTTILGGSMTSVGKSVESFVAGGYVSKPSGSDGTQTKDLTGNGAGRIGTPAIADLYTAVDITMQLAALVKTPPLVLLINPTTLNLKYTKKQQYTERTRYGYVFQAWGEDQPKLSIESKCGAFISGERGVQFASRRDSPAWQNLATAFHFYRHNGYIYDTVGKSNAHHFVGALSIHYDGWVYYGNMESFNYAFDENQGSNGGIVFSMEFTVNAMVDTSKSSLVVSPLRSPVPSPSDPRYFGMRNQASPNPGDIALNTGDGISFAGDKLGLLGTQAVAKGTQAVVGAHTAAAGNKGFAKAPAPPVAAPAAPSKKPAPFGFRGR